MDNMVIALMYDFDQTLSPHFMQKPLFAEYGLDEEHFWEEADQAAKAATKLGVNVDHEFAYLNHILKSVRQGKMPGLTNRKLRELGRNIQFFPGLPEFFSQIDEQVRQEPAFRNQNITLEHYVISTGLKEMVLGSAIAPALTDAFASELIEEDGAVAYIGRAVGYIKKTEYLHLINKGANVDSRININGVLPEVQRRVPFTQMIYLGDGFTDVPCFATLNHRGGTCLAVYDPDSERSLGQAQKLHEQQRVCAYAPADYRQGSRLFELIATHLRRIAAAKE